MDASYVSADYVIAELLDMGFEFSKAIEATKAVGPCLDDAVEFLLSGLCKNNDGKNNAQNLNHRWSSNLNNRSKVQGLGKWTSSPLSQGHLKQTTIAKHLHFSDKAKRSKSGGNSDVSTSILNSSESGHVKDEKLSSHANCKLESATKLSPLKLDAHEPIIKSESTSLETSSSQSCSLGTHSDWEQKVSILLHEHFGISSLKSFQKEALDAWSANQDCLVLAATGSGKSLCFQLPALLSGKVVVVISPLISLMHDQCLKLSKHGISACFLGSGQTDSSVERKAMDGIYGIVYICPETIMRLIEPLQRLAENRGIALFAIDEVHCISKWGHDFRPDYRRLSILRENFKACNLKSLKYDIPLMALTATATVNVREDILKSLLMSKETKIVLTSFFRPNLQFSVKHSKTSHPSSYKRDFHELIDTYTSQGNVGYCHSGNISPNSEGSDSSSGSASDSIFDADEILSDNFNNYDDENDGGCDEVSSANENGAAASKENQLSVEFLEEELDSCSGVDILDVASGEFYGNAISGNHDFYGSSETVKITTQPGKGEAKELLGHGPTIIYVPTRKETLTLTQHLCRFGVNAAAYHAKLPKSHLRCVHDQFHQNILQVVVATIAFGMGIDKSNVRRIIHYGWPQSLEAYYQEAGRAGRDGKLAECTLYADLSRIPTLLPSQRSEEQTKKAYKMLSDCYKYGMATALCRAKILVNYFGEDFGCNKCLLCDICVGGPPELQNMKPEADAFMKVLAAHYKMGSPPHRSFSYNNGMHGKVKRGRYIDRPNIKMVVSRIREQLPKFSASDRLWWQGLACILEDKGLIREGDDVVRVCIKYPELTDLGLKFLQSADEDFYAYPQADMLLSKQIQRPYSTFSEWGRGWADPEIRRQRLQRKKYSRKTRKRWSRDRQDLRTVRGRIEAKLLKAKR